MTWPTDWQPPAPWLRFTTVDAHTGGEPFRVITSGFPELRGATILERRRDAETRFDHLRRLLMWEPRGHADMYGCLLTPPVTPTADFGILFLHNAGFSTMCGHGVIAITTVVLQTGMLPVTGATTTVHMDSPAGLITARGHSSDGRIASVAFENVPSFVLDRDATIEVEGLGRIRYDLAFGGAFYAFVQAADIGLTCEPADASRLVSTGMAIKRAIMAARPIPHPFEPDLSFLYGVIFVGPPATPGHHSRNVCVFAEGEVDRSPTGTGVSARLALHHARGELASGEPIVIESIVGSCFTGRVLATTTFGPHAAVIPEVASSAFLTGQHEFCLDPADPFPAGFLLR